MFDDFEAYFHENVWSSFQDYAKARKKIKARKSEDLRLALISASALFHLREHLPAKKSQSYAALVHRCPDYELLGDVVNASKHRTLTHRKNPLIKGAQNISEQIVCTVYADELGEYRHVEKNIFIQLKDGTEQELFSVLVHMMNMWLKRLNELGLIKKINPVDVHPKRIPRRTKNWGKMDLVITRGLRFASKIRMQKFKYSTGKTEPVDLTGSELSMRIYQPRYTLQVSATDPHRGKEITFDVSLSSQEKKKLEGLKTEQEKVAYMLTLAEAQGIIELKH